MRSLYFIGRHVDIFQLQTTLALFIQKKKNQFYHFKFEIRCCQLGQGRGPNNWIVESKGSEDLQTRMWVLDFWVGVIQIVDQRLKKIKPKKLGVDYVLTTTQIFPFFL